MPKCILFKSGVTVTTTGMVKPCCLYRTRRHIRIDQEWESTFSRKDKLMENGWIPECIQCKDAESRDEKSDRLDAAHILDGTRYEFWDLKINNTCNLACRMCNPHSSSTFQKNVNSNTSENWAPIFREGANSKMWFRDENIHTILDKIIHAKRIKFTGGEPFLIPQIKTILQHLIDNKKSKNITLSFVTNGTQPMNKWLELFRQFKNVIISISVDAIEDRFEYIRAGAKWNQVKEHIEYLSTNKQDNVDIQISILPSVLNYNNIDDVVDWCNSLGLTYDISGPVMYPEFMSPSALSDPKLRKQFIEQMDIQDRIHGTDWRKFVKL